MESAHGEKVRTLSLSTLDCGGRGGVVAKPAWLLLLFNTTRTHSGPPSTGATITMDGGVADTARANTRRINTGR